MYLGDFAGGALVTCRFNTADPTNTPVTFAGTPAMQVRKGSAGGTILLVGLTLTVDVVTGQQCVDIDTTQSGYAAGADYAIEVKQGTVNGVSVAGWVFGTFSIVNRLQSGDAYARLGAPAGASVSADVAAVKSDTGTIVATTNKFAFDGNSYVKADVEDWKGATAPAMTGDAYARLGPPTGANVSADVAAVKSDTASIVSSLASLVANIWAAVVDSPGVTTLLARLTGTRAGNLDNLDVAVSTRLATSGYTAPDNGDIAAIKATLGAAGAGLTSIPNPSNLDVAVSTRLASSGYTAPDNANIATIASKLPANAMADETLVLAATTAIMSRLGAPAGASVSADVAAVKSDTGTILGNQPEGVKRNTALNAFSFFMVDATDHVSGKTGLSVSAQRSIDGGAFAPCANAATEIGLGWYAINLAASDLNGTVVGLILTAPGADASSVTLKTAA